MRWNAEKIPGAGAILLPSPSSKLILNVAALLTSPFPEVVIAPSHVTHLPGISPYTLQDSQYTRFQQPSGQGTSSSVWTHPYGP
jgi:hypothetical protein